MWRRKRASENEAPGGLAKEKMTKNKFPKNKIKIRASENEAPGGLAKAK